MKSIPLALKAAFAAMILVVSAGFAMAGELTYPVVDTGQKRFFSNSRVISAPSKGESFYGQDAQYTGNEPKYRDNGDGTVSDLVTGLMWVKARGKALTWTDARNRASECRVGGYDDWRMPTIKELYSLILFSGWHMPKSTIPYIDARYFEFKFGDTKKGQRAIDCQDWSSTVYTGATMDGQATAFGVNFADGRIKGYPMRERPGRAPSRYVRYVRGNPEYGKNIFVEDGDTVTDMATGLMWQKADSGKTMNWEDALKYAENLKLGGFDDWRLPSVKELQTIVDYTRSPGATNSAAINPIFKVTKVESYYWSGTTHMDGPRNKAGSDACYVAFGRAMGYMQTPRSSGKRDLDVHGAGAQRSDPKSGQPTRGFGPQGDDRRVYNYVRCVRGGNVTVNTETVSTSLPSSSDPRFVNHGGNGDMPTSGPRGMSGRPSSGGGFGGMGRMHRNGPPSGGQGSRPGGRMGPPPESFTACDNLSEGDDCSFEAPHGTVAGVCVSGASKLHCRPNNMPGGQGMRGGPGMSPMQ